MRIDHETKEGLLAKLPRRYAYLVDPQERTTAYAILTLGVDALRCEENLIQSCAEGTVDDHGNVDADYQFYARQPIRTIFAYLASF